MNYLEPRYLLNAYCQGVFPMAHEDGIYWYAPDPRAILPLDNFHISNSLERTVKQGKFDILVNRDFDAVIRACAQLAPGRESTWISDEIIAAYTRLHHLGFAHSVEAWQNDQLVGGLYGVAINGLFAGESMFSQARDASKVALVHLVRRLRQRGYQLLDVQFSTPHLARFGVVEIPRADYEARLEAALLVKAIFASATD